ncbi:hypothetical protein P5P86_19305 [Nocardioides sp. BP30]|uniref:hypothetical protein n=1 Tax=Nocardioides sp. BP30 TaxID=3036374 RepID=UPI0024682A97|nr:hypothetical protein [Nocardioides sp. BP30]WGL52085.1 hypothetical protein P5P86_19305 [Nocardioides sp. BP30]
MALRRMRTRTIALATAVVVLLGVAVVVGVKAWDAARRSDLQRAMALAPKDAQRYSWTDWAAVRAALGTSSDSKLLDAGYDADLTPASSLTTSVDLMHSAFGFTPATLSWELLTQSTSGATLLLRVADSVSFASIRTHLKAAGFTAPQGADGVWDGSAVDGTGGVPILSYVSLDEHRHLVVTSDTDSFLAQAVDKLGAGSVPQPIARVVDAVDEPLAAEIYDGDYTCGKLAMGNADPTDEAQGVQLISEAGKVNPVLGFAMAREPGPGGKAGDVRVALAFANHDQAVTNATTRAKLASGQAPGQGGTFPDRFTLGKVAASGAVVTMALRPKNDSPVLSDLSTGPLLFATC